MKWNLRVSRIPSSLNSAKFRRANDPRYKESVYELGVRSTEICGFRGLSLHGAVGDDCGRLNRATERECPASGSG